MNLFLTPINQVLVGGSNGKIQKHTSNNQMSTVSGHKDRVTRVKTFPNSDLALSCSWDGEIKLWNTTDLNLLRTYKTLEQENALEILNNELFACGSTFKIAFWSIYNETKLKAISVNSPVSSLIMITNEILASGQEDGTVKFWNITNGQLLKTYDNHYTNIWDLELIDNQTLASASQDGNIIIRNFVTGQIISNLTGHTNRVTVLKRLTNNLILSGSWDENIFLWNLKKNTPILDFHEHTGAVYGLDMLDDDTLVSGSFDQTIKFWQISTGKLLRSINTGLNIWSLVILN